MAAPSFLSQRIAAVGKGGHQFTPAGVARVLCATLNNGFSAEEICSELKDHCDWDCQSDPDCNKKRKEAVAIAQQLIQGNNEILTTADAVLGLLNISLRGLALLSTVIPALRPFAIPLRLASGQVGTVRTSITARKAANDELIQSVLRLAA